MLYLFWWTGNIGALSALAASAAHMMTQSILNIPVESDTDMRKNTGVANIRALYPKDTLQDVIGCRNLNILIVGNNAISKSSLINTIITAFSDVKIERATSGRKGSMVDTYIRGYSLPEPIDYITLIDGVSLDSIQLDEKDWKEIMQGYYPSKIYQTNGNDIKTPYGAIHGIIIALPTVIEDVGDTSYLDYFMDICQTHGISPMVSLVKVEKYYPELTNIMKTSDYSEWSMDVESILDVLQKPMQQWSEAIGVYESHMWPIITYNSLRHKSATADLLARKLIFETIKQGTDIAMGRNIVKDYEPPMRTDILLLGKDEVLRLHAPAVDENLQEESLEQEQEYVIVEEPDQQQLEEKENQVLEEEDHIVEYSVASVEPSPQPETEHEDVVVVPCPPPPPPPIVMQPEDISEVVLPTDKSVAFVEDTAKIDTPIEVQKISKETMDQVEPQPEVLPPVTPQTQQTKQQFVEPDTEHLAKDAIVTKDTDKNMEAEVVTQRDIQSGSSSQVVEQQQEISFIQLARQRLEQQSSSAKMRDIRSIVRPGPTHMEVGAV
eukprot:TRINITY_DN49136_c0_g1_i1.p1 TRINITY_DN49136_c0_g1~~TRINITY_DN49136_c0_g1_i1.p1  ORF type:complete len:550 (+),score=64.10 TRINITY_DN49136_c0_g1_i1:166-1815(+)